MSNITIYIVITFIYVCVISLIPTLYIVISFGGLYTIQSPFPIFASHLIQMVETVNGNLLISIFYRDQVKLNSTVTTLKNRTPNNVLSVVHEVVLRG